MRRLMLAPALFLALPGVVLADPTEVTRFHTPESLAQLAPGSAIAVVVPPEMGPASLADSIWLAAITQELAARGFGAATPGAADRIAEVRVEQSSQRQERQRGPVSVGVGGSTGGWNSGVGLGVGFSLGGGSREWLYTRISVTIRDRETGRALWEARAEGRDRVKKNQPVDATSLAQRFARALFADFPGKSGATIEVK